MPLLVDFDRVAESFLCSSFYCDKRLGMPVEYGVTLIFNHANSYRIEEIAALLAADKNKFSLSFNGHKILNMVELSECVYVEHPAENRILVKHIQNKFKDYEPGAFKIRKRVLKAPDLLTIFNKYFSNLVKMDNTIEYALQKVKFTDNEKNNLIQYQQTDHEFLIKLINWYNTIAKPEDIIAISGAATDNRYQLVWVQEEKCNSFQYPSQRKLDDLISSNFKPKMMIGKYDAATPFIYKKNKRVPDISYVINRGNFDMGEWDKWKKVELPAFYDNKYTYHTRDIFEDRKDENLAWDSQISTIPRKELQGIELMENMVWMGIGKVTNRTPTSFWIEVELPGFEKDANKVDVRVTSPYSGHAGNAGFHLVPEKGTEVQILKGSDLLAPLTLLHNVRSKDAAEKAPFWKLEDTAKWDFQTLEKSVKEMKTTADETITWKTKGVTTKMDSSKMEIS